MSKRIVMAMLAGCFALWGGGIIAMKFAYGSFAGNQTVFARVAFASLFYLCLWKNGRHFLCQKKCEKGRDRGLERSRPLLFEGPVKNYSRKPAGI